MKLKSSNILEVYIKQYHGSIHFHALAIHCSIITTSFFGSVIKQSSMFVCLTYSCNDIPVIDLKNRLDNQRNLSTVSNYSL